MTVRLWDCVSGSQVRLMTGHKGSISSLAFSCEGRFLSSAGADHRVLVWDLAHGHLVAALSGHTENIHCLSFSRDGNILVSGNFPGMPWKKKTLFGNVKCNFQFLQDP